MSDSNYAKMCQWRKIHEVVDDAWLEEALSDDDVEIPSGDVFAEEGAFPASRERAPPRAPRAPFDDERHIFATLDCSRDDHYFSPRSLRTKAARPRRRGVASPRRRARGDTRAPRP